MFEPDEDEDNDFLDRLVPAVIAALAFSFTWAAHRALMAVGVPEFVAWFFGAGLVCLLLQYFEDMAVPALAEAYLNRGSKKTKSCEHCSPELSEQEDERVVDHAEKDEK